MKVSPLNIVLLLAVLACGLLLWWLIEPYEETVFRGYSDEARRNPYLAAEQFLQNKVTQIESGNQLALLDRLQPGSVLIINNTNAVLNQPRADELVQWLREGGNLIVAANYSSEDDPDVLLSRFQITKEDVDDGFFPGDADGFLQELEQLVEEAEREAFEQEAARRKLEMPEKLREQEANTIEGNQALLEFEGMDYVLYADFSGSGSLSHPAFYLAEDETWEDDQPFYWAGNEVAVGFLQMEVGEGMLTVASDLNIWQPDQIGLFDHALLLEILTSYADHVVFLYGANVPNLLQQLWQHFSELILALSVLLLLWIIYHFRRFGPVQVLEYNRRRQYREHIATMAEYRWRQGEGETLLAGLRRDIAVRVFYRSSGTVNMDNKQQLAQRLMELIDITPKQASAAVGDQVPNDEMKFYVLVKLLQKIRNRL